MSLCLPFHHIKQQPILVNVFFSFSDFMLSIFGDSQRTLHDTFMQTYGHLYEKNSDLFEDFFKELRRYYERGNDNLFEITNKLFSKLYQRMFQVSFFSMYQTPHVYHKFIIIDNSKTFKIYDMS